MDIDFFGGKKATLYQLWLNEASIKKCIAKQDKYDIALEKMSVKEYEVPFKAVRMAGNMNIP